MDDKTKEYTKVIAEFIGYKKTSTAFVLDKKLVGIGLPWIVTNEYNFGFDSNYNFLMPVWVKFRDVNNGYCNFAFGTEKSNKLTEFKQKICDELLFGTNQQAFSALAEAIIWYNNNKE